MQKYQSAVTEMYKFAHQCGTGRLFINTAKQYLKNPQLLAKEAKNWGVPANDVKTCLELVVLESA